MRSRLEQVAVVLCVLTVLSGSAGAAIIKLRAKHERRQMATADVTLQPAKYSDGATSTAEARTEPRLVAEPHIETQAGSAPDILRNDEVIELTKAGVGQEVIRKMIDKIPHAFRIDPKSVLEMKRAGVVDAVIAQMLDVTEMKKGLPAAPPAAGSPEHKQLWVKNGSAGTSAGDRPETAGALRAAQGLFAVTALEKHE